MFYLCLNHFYLCFYLFVKVFYTTSKILKYDKKLSIVMSLTFFLVLPKGKSSQRWCQVQEVKKSLCIMFYYQMSNQLFYHGGPYHIETSPLICRANQWTGFYMIGTFVMNELKWSCESFHQNIFVICHIVNGKAYHECATLFTLASR